MGRKKKESKIISFNEALKTLTDVADFEVQKPEETKDYHLAPERVKELTEELSEGRVRQIFGVILEHLQESFSSKSPYVLEKKRLEDVHSIMVLVGEAAEKLDKYSRIFQLKSGESVTQLAEYKRLKDFYSHKIEKQVDVGLLGKWIIGLAGGLPTKEDERKSRMIKKEKSRHVFVDLDMVKKDTDYELLLLRKEDGSRFFSPRLLRNIRIVSDFGSYSGEEVGLFEDMDSVRDRVCQRGAISLLKSLRIPMERFYQEAFRHKDKDAVAALNKCFIALYLAAGNREHVKGMKGNSDYFSDMISYLRECLQTRYYQKLVLYPPKHPSVVGACVVDTSHNLSRGVILHLSMMGELFGQILDKLTHAESLFPTTTRGLSERGAFLWSRLAYDFAEIVKALQKSARGPLQRVLESIEEGKQSAFDSTMQGNFSYPLYFLDMGEEHITTLRLPSPTRQTQINKAVATDEFKAYLLSASRQNVETKHLLVNLQDRTSWKEFARASCLEQLSKSSQFKPHLEVMTLAVDTPFYHQNGPYLKEDSAEEFKANFLDQLSDTATGFYFSDSLKQVFIKGFFQDLMEAVHEQFFHGEKFLSQNERTSFIAIYYILLSLKAVEIVKPTGFSFSCKDGVDTSTVYSAGLLMLMRWIQSPKLRESDIRYLKALFFGPAIFVRERAPLADTVSHLLHILQTIEGIKERVGYSKFHEDFMKAFNPLFDFNFEELQLSLPIVEWEEEKEEAA